MKKVVGFAGRAGSGKSTAAAMLHSIASPEKGYNIEFSDPIVSMAQQWLDVTPRNVTPQEAMSKFVSIAIDFDKSSLQGLARAGNDSPLIRNYFSERPASRITGETKTQHRMLLEWLGKGVVDHVDPAYWSNIAQARATNLLEEGADLVTLCGVRSEYDAQAVRNIGGSIVRLTRGTPGQLLPTEAGINAWQEDFHIVNNGTLDDLQERIRTLDLTGLPEVEAI